MGFTLHPEVGVGHELYPFAVQIGVPLEGARPDGHHVWVYWPIPGFIIPDVLWHNWDIFEPIYGPGVWLFHVDYNRIIAVCLNIINFIH